MLFHSPLMIITPPFVVLREGAVLGSSHNGGVVPAGRVDDLRSPLDGDGERIRQVVVVAAGEVAGNEACR
jgi:hypothetical protein